MNLGRFHGAVLSLMYEFEGSDIVEELNQLQAALSQSISQPTPQTAAAFKTRLLELGNLLESCPSDEATPSRRKIIEQLGATRITGRGLLDRIKEIVGENLITPADALKQINELSQEVGNFQKTLSALATGLENLNVEFDDLVEGEFEIGITIPESVLRGNLSNYEKELKCINELLKVLAEVATGQVGQFKVRTIGTTDLQVFVQTAAVVVTCVAATIERVVALYKQQLEIKKIKLEIEQMHMPDKVTKPFEDHVKDVVEKELAAIAKDLIKQFYKKKDGGRKNELTTHATKVLRYMAERVDKGASFEVRAGEPEEPKKPQAEDEVAQAEHEKAIEAYKKTRAYIEQLNSAGRSILELPLRHEKILMLPEPYESEGDTNPKEEADKE